ncbi:putative Serine carboxypeptidase [Trypanosoma vivax]|nr:putative Serine carboxypeptidase [Trypanosoma vivax]KAH8617957.1 putative Serine carboxypeptidase [Trypanosoma vivax]
MSFHAPARLAVVALCCALVVCVAASEYPEVEYGYIESSAEFGSSFFYAIKASSTASRRERQPLVLWLQGGPGASSQLSDLLETGPVAIQAANNSEGYVLRRRNHTWAERVTMLYVDNPVGTGFSYSMDPRGLVSSDEEVGIALVDFLARFLRRHSEYLNNDLWIFSESYGGKMAAHFGATLGARLKGGSFPYPQLRFKGVEIGDGWVGPVDCMYSYGPYLRSFAQVSPRQATFLERFAALAKGALEKGDGARATSFWEQQQRVMSDYADGVNVYNVMFYRNYLPDEEGYLRDNLTASLKRSGIMPDWVSYGSQSSAVFDKMRSTFMRDAVAQVDALLHMGYEVHVVSGQLDLIVNTLCADAWVSRLQWPYISRLYDQERTPLTLSGDRVAGFVQSYKNMHIWTINAAGHMAPADFPEATELMLTVITRNSSGPGLHSGSRRSPGLRVMRRRAVQGRGHSMRSRGAQAALCVGPTTVTKGKDGTPSAPRPQRIPLHVMQDSVRARAHMCIAVCMRILFRT